VRSTRPAGIAGYGAYVPRLRVRTSDISDAWRPRGAVAPAVAEKSVPVSHVTDTPDFFRREGAAYPEHGGRFTGEPSYFRHTRAASRRLLEEVDAGPKDFAVRAHHEPVRIAAASVATDTIALAARSDVLTMSAAAVSAQKAYAAAGRVPRDMDLFEAHDAFTIITALSLEACGFGKRGEALRLAAEGCIAPDGGIPISTFGGLKARGHPVGASGAYQIVEAALQLRGEGGENQVKGARRALAQSVGGHGSVAVTHILEA
jgi:hypothetical protein